MPTRIPLLDLTRHHALIAGEVDRAWRETLTSMHLLGGQQVRLFEQEIAAYAGVPHACGVSSGTDALLLSLIALGIGPGSRVVVPANAFVAALSVIHHLGATPILVDVADDSHAPDLDAIARALPAAAVIVVHLYGHAFSLDQLHTLCDRSHTPLIEDASHAHGAKRRGRHVGTTGTMGCFSAGIVKNLSAYGDAGFILTRDAALDSTLRELRNQGQRGKNQHARYGLNARLDELQAAVLRIKLRSLDERNRRRLGIAEYYNERFADLDVRVPDIADDEQPVFHQYVLRCAQRDRLQAHLGARGIETGIHYPIPLHQQTAWVQRYGALTLPRVERLATEILSLPVFPELTDGEVETVVSAVNEFFHSPHRSAERAAALSTS